MTDLTTLGKYQITEILGSGGYATTYRAHDSTLDRDIALKVLHPVLLVDKSFVERFFREARTVARLRHSGIVTIFEVGQAEGRVFIAMELARASLDKELAIRGPLPWADTLPFLRFLCRALDYAHQQGVVHRDLKPANILLAENGRPLLSDFGFARLASQSSASLSASGGILGTPSYIAPETWEQNVAEAPADRYALACIAYELLTGNILFKGETPFQAMRAHDRGPQFPVQWPAGVPNGVDQVLARALSRDPIQRFESSMAFWTAFSEAGATVSEPIAEPGEAAFGVSNGPSQGEPERTTRRWNARTSLLWGVGILVILGALFLIPSLIPSGSEPRGTTTVTSTITAFVDTQVPTVDPNASAPTAAPGVSAPTVDPNAPAPTVDPNAPAPTVDPNAPAVLPTADIRQANPAIVNANTPLQSQGWIYDFSQPTFAASIIGNLGQYATTNGHFVVVLVNVINNTGTDQPMPGNFFVLKDAQGRVWASQPEVSEAYVVPGVNADLAHTQPLPADGITRTVAIIFDVASDATDLVFFARSNPSQGWLVLRDV